MFGWLVEMVWNEAGYVMVMVCYQVKLTSWSVYGWFNGFLEQSEGMRVE